MGVIEGLEMMQAACPDSDNRRRLAFGRGQRRALVVRRCRQKLHHNAQTGIRARPRRRSAAQLEWPELFGSIRMLPLCPCKCKREFTIAYLTFPEEGAGQGLRHNTNWDLRSRRMYFRESAIRVLKWGANCHRVTELLQRKGGINDQAFSTTQSQVWMHESDVHSG